MVEVYTRPSMNENKVETARLFRPVSETLMIRIVRANTHGTTPVLIASDDILPTSL